MCSTRAPTGIDEGQGTNCYNEDWIREGLDDPKGKVESFHVIRWRMRYS